MGFQLHPANESVLTPFEWEKHDFEHSFRWMERNWHLGLGFAGVYILAIHWGREEMKSQRPMRLQRSLFWWNVFLAVFSFMGFVRIFPELYALLISENGFYKSVCSREQQTVTTAFWCLMSTWSKVVELVDTGFVVLRKQPLIFLHWYHHTTVMLFAFYTFPSFDPANRWFIGMNYFIHGVMYTYYALKANGMKLPRQVAMTITSMQFLQMVIGVGVNLYTLGLFWAGTDCSRQLADIIVCLAMYFSYLILFGMFFYNSYVRKSTKTE